MGQRATFLCTLVSYRNNGEYSLFEFAPTLSTGGREVRNILEKMQTTEK